MERNIIHVNISAFAVAVERVVNPRLKERPVIVASLASERSLVYSASYEARQAGITKGMPVRKALKLCRDVTILAPNEPLYNRASRAILTLLGQFSPVIEPVGYGHAYLDMTHTSRLWGPTKDAAAKAQREIKSQLHLDASLGVASNKLVSKIASAVIKPNGLQDVRRGDEEDFIAPLSVNYLPGVSSSVKSQLFELNIHVIRQLAHISVQHLIMAFGRLGILLHQKAHGIDNSPVRPLQQVYDIYQEQILAEDTNDYFALRAILYHLIERCARQLRLQNRLANRIAIAIRYADYKEASLQAKLPMSSNLDQEIFASAENVLKHMLTRRFRVRKIAVRLFDLIMPSHQLSLFPNRSSSKIQQLTPAVDRIRQKFGPYAIYFGIAA